MKTFKLENEPKIKTGFKTPDHYFENFSKKIMEQIPVSEPKVISIFEKRKKLILMVAAVLLLALMIPLLNSGNSNSKELDSATLENYITYESNMNQYDLINVLETDDLNKINTSLALEDEAIEDQLYTNSNLENLILE